MVGYRVLHWKSFTLQFWRHLMFEIPLLLLRSFMLIPFLFIWNFLSPVLWNFTLMCLVQSLLIYYITQLVSFFNLALHVFQLWKFFGIISLLLPFCLLPPSFSLFSISTVSPWIDLLISSYFLCLFVLLSFLWSFSTLSF